MTPIGVAGLGVVGGALADALADAGVEVRGYDTYRGIGAPASLSGCEVVFLCVPTSSDATSGFDLIEVWRALGVIAPHLEAGTIIGMRSTVPPGTSDLLAETFPALRFVSAPEFLVAERARETLTRPDRTVIGSASPEAGIAVARILGLVAPDSPVLFMRNVEAELVKLCSNAMLSAKVSMANELFEVSRAFGVDWARIQDAVGLDHRIGPDHLTVTEERGFGGACLPKDLDGLVAATTNAGYDPPVLRGIAGFNRAVRSLAAVEAAVVGTHAEGSNKDGRLPTSGNGARTGPRRARYLFYSHDGLGLGHVRRNLAIASALHELEPGTSVLIATSVDEVGSMGLPPNADVLKLPAIRKLDNERYAARSLPIGREEIRDLRAQLLEAAARSFRPRVLLSDRHPFGIGGELLPALKGVRAAGGHAILGLRDVLDDPRVIEREWAAGGFAERIPTYFDRVLVYGQPEVFDTVRRYRFPEPVAAITNFCGYVLGNGAHPDGPRLGVGGARPLVLATAGGGETGADLLGRFLEASAEGAWEAVVVTGPQCPDDERRRLAELADRVSARQWTFVPGLASHFASLGALVCMGGYNTLVEAVASGSPTVCVPRVRPRREQLLRAQAFARLGLVTLVSPEGLTAEALRSEIVHTMRISRHALRRAGATLDLGGAERAARHLVDVTAGRAKAPGALDPAPAG